MNALQLLEQKISSLVEKTKELKDRNDFLEKEVISLGKEKKNLEAQTNKLADNNMKLAARLEGLEKKAVEGSDQINELNQERALTKMAVNDLLERLKSIDSLVEKQ